MRGWFAIDQPTISTTGTEHHRQIKEASGGWHEGDIGTLLWHSTGYAGGASYGVFSVKWSFYFPIVIGSVIRAPFSFIMQPSDRITSYPVGLDRSAP